MWWSKKKQESKCTRYKVTFVYRLNNKPECYYETYYCGYKVDEDDIFRDIYARRMHRRVGARIMDVVPIMSIHIVELSIDEVLE